MTTSSGTWKKKSENTGEELIKLEDLAGRSEWVECTGGVGVVDIGGGDRTFCSLQLIHLWCRGWDRRSLLYLYVSRVCWIINILSFCMQVRVGVAKLWKELFGQFSFLKGAWASWKSPIFSGRRRALLKRVTFQVYGIIMWDWDRHSFRWILTGI